MFAFSLSWVSIFLRLIRCRFVPEKMEGKERGGRNSFGRCCFGCRIKIERLDEEWRFLFCMGPKGLGKLKIHNLCVFFNCNFFFYQSIKASTLCSLFYLSPLFGCTGNVQKRQKIETYILCYFLFQESTNWLEQREIVVDFSK